MYIYIHIREEIRLQLNLMLCTEASWSFGHSLDHFDKTQPRQIVGPRRPLSNCTQLLLLFVVVCCCCLFLCVLIPVGRWWWWVFNGRRWANLNYVWFYFLLLLLQQNWLWFRLGQSGANLRSICLSSHSLRWGFEFDYIPKKILKTY